MLTERPIKIFLISDVVPIDAPGGQSLIYRHLVGHPEFQIEWSTPKSPFMESRLWKRLKNTRLNGIPKAIESSFAKRSVDKVTLKRIDDFCPDLILTVAHGLSYLSTPAIANSLKKPLVTIFHDWWPDIVCSRISFRFVHQKPFKKQFDVSDLNFVVSQGMKRRLGVHKNVVVLPPIPGNTSRFSTPNSFDCDSPDKPMSVCYAGNLFHYGPQMLQLMLALEESKSVDLKVRGADPNWPSEFKEKYGASETWLPPIFGDDLRLWQRTFDCHLCVMEFEPSARRRMETSFLSKLVDSLKFEKPIVIWGPDYCSAVEWARQNDSAFVVTDPCPKAAAQRLIVLANDRKLQQHYALQAKESQAEFDPRRLQNLFLNSVADLAGVKVA